MRHRTQGYALTERVVKPQATLCLPDTDWADALADVFLHGVLAAQDGWASLQAFRRPPVHGLGTADGESPSPTANG